MRLHWIGWDEDRADHIWTKHHVTEEELADAFCATENVVPVMRRAKHGRYQLVSHTSSGRSIKAILEVCYKDNEPGLRRYWLDPSTDSAEQEIVTNVEGGFIVTAYETEGSEQRWVKYMLRR